MAIVIPPRWVSTQAYAVGAKVNYNGTGYECRTEVSQNNSGNTIPVDNASWRRYAVFGIEDYYSLQDAIEIAINVDDDEINESIPLFINNAELAISKLVRSPAQLIEREFAVDSDCKFAIPSDLLNIEHLRFKGDAGNTAYLTGQGRLEIVASNKSEFERLKQLHGSPGFDPFEFDTPVYWNDDQYIYITPCDTGGEVILTYYQAVPTLGTVAGVLNDDFEPINSAGQTVTQWVAAGGSNTAANFVQDTTAITQNLWTASCPHLLRLGALISAESYLKDDARLPVWKESYTKNLQETLDEFERFHTNRSHHQGMNSAYLGNL